MNSRVKTISRRSFLSGAGIAAVGVGLARTPINAFATDSLLLRCAPPDKIGCKVPGMKPPGRDEISCSVPSAPLQETGTEHPGDR